MKVMELSTGPGQRNKGTDARVGYLYKLPPSGDLSAMIDYKYNNMSLFKGNDISLTFTGCPKEMTNRRKS